MHFGTLVGVGDSPASRDNRIARCLKLFFGALANRYIPLLDSPDSSAADGLIDVQPQPILVNRHGDHGAARYHRIDQPVPTITTRGGGYLCHPVVSAMPTPFVVQYNAPGPRTPSTDRCPPSPPSHSMD